MKWVLRKTGPPAFLVKDEGELSKASAGKRVYLLGYFSQLEASPGALPACTCGSGPVIAGTACMSLTA